MHLRRVMAAGAVAAALALGLALEHVDELMLALGLVLVALGFRVWWAPGAYLVPGIVIVWLFLPQRKAFFERPARRREE